MDFDRAKVEAVANKTFDGLAMYVRDVDLDPAIAAKYVDGLVIRERGYTDASRRVMGMVTTHRYAILSNHMADMSEVGDGASWGLCVAKRGSHFKVLGQATHNGKTAIFLLHLPDDDDWRVFQYVHTSVEDEVLALCIERFRAKCDAPPIPELASREWRSRCAWPVGFAEDGEQFPVE